MKDGQTTQYALILGASSGFGAAAAIALAKKGIHIIGVHLDRAATMKNVEETKQAIEAAGVKALFFNVNAADAAKRAEVIAAIQEEFSTAQNPNLVLLLHSLAFGALRQFIAEQRSDTITQKQVEMTMDVMANSLIYWTQDVVYAGLMGKGGRVIGLTSAGATRVLPMYGAVSAAKTALEAYTRQLALELAPFGITANTIRAGVTHTAALSKIPGSDVIMNNAYMRNPYHRLTTPEDIANVLTLLVQPESAWINGEIIGVDGGEDAVDLTWWKPEQQS